MKFLKKSLEVIGNIIKTIWMVLNHKITFSILFYPLLVAVIGIIVTCIFGVILPKGALLWALATITWLIILGLIGFLIDQRIFVIPFVVCCYYEYFAYTIPNLQQPGWKWAYGLIFLAIPLFLGALASLGSSGSSSSYTSSSSDYSSYDDTCESDNDWAEEYNRTHAAEPVKPKQSKIPKGCKLYVLRVKYKNQPTQTYHVIGPACNAEVIRQPLRNNPNVETYTLGYDIEANLGRYPMISPL